MVEAACVVIEALSDGPVRFGDAACTPLGTRYVTVFNGFPKREGAHGIQSPTVERACADMVDTATAMKVAVGGPAVLCWRHVPELEWGLFDGRLFYQSGATPKLVGGQYAFAIYSRFCFEGL